MSLIAVESWESESARELSNAIFVPSGDHTAGCAALSLFCLLCVLTVHPAGCAAHYHSLFVNSVSVIRQWGKTERPN